MPARNWVRTRRGGLGVVEVPATLAADVGQEQAGDVVGGLVRVDPRPQARGAQVGDQRRPQLGHHHGSVGRELLEQGLGLGGQDLLQEVVLVDDAMADLQGVGQAGLEIVIGGDGLADRLEERVDLRRDRGADDLVRPGERAVERGPRQPGFGRDVLEARLGQSLALDAGPSGFDDAASSAPPRPGRAA
jgi:hypothetical protein